MRVGQRGAGVLGWQAKNRVGEMAINLGAPFARGSCGGVHGVPVFKWHAASRRHCSILMGGPDVSGPYEHHHPTPTFQIYLQGQHVCHLSPRT